MYEINGATGGNYNTYTTTTIINILLILGKIITVAFELVRVCRVFIRLWVPSDKSAFKLT